MLRNPSRNNFLFWLILLVYTSVFCLISLVNHYYFRTYAWDLGINNNAIYDYAHFRWNDCMIMQPQFTNVLSDHFSLLPLLFSPLYWIFGTYTMLIVQIAGIVFGGIGVYRYFSEKDPFAYWGHLAMIHFFSIWGIYSALGFDYHDNVMAAMFVPWLFYFFEKDRKILAAVFLVLILVSKENMALWALFICLGMAILYRRDRIKVRRALMYALSAGLYFIVIVKLVIPALANENRDYLHFCYSALGGTFGEVIKTIFSNPRYAFSLLFENQTQDPFYNGIKSELHLMVLLSGGLALIYRPAWLLMLVPVYAQKMFNDDYGKWGINAQYSIEFVPILTFAVFSWLKDFKNIRFRNYAAGSIVFLTFAATAVTLETRRSLWYDSTQLKFYWKRHYERNFDVQKAYKALELIPDDAKVSAQLMLVPHLAFRDYIYWFPVVEDAEYIVLLEGESTYPLDQKQYDKLKAHLLETGWKFIYNEDHVQILRKF